MSIRLVNAAKKLNKGTLTIVEYLTSKGYTISNEPTSRITQEMYDALVLEFKGIDEPKKEADSQIEHIKLFWEILPPGQYKWNVIKNKANQMIERRNHDPAKRNEVQDNLEFIIGLKPNFTAIGRKGFSGYLVFGFTKLNIYILENTMWGNATYIFENEWEKLSKLTKQKILAKKLLKKRIFHKSNWRKNIIELLKKNRNHITKKIRRN